MDKLYDRADIYDLIESESRTEVIRKDWEEFLGCRKIGSILDVSIGSGGMTLPLQEQCLRPCLNGLRSKRVGKAISKTAQTGPSLRLRMVTDPWDSYASSQ